MKAANSAFVTGALPIRNGAISTSWAHFSLSKMNPSAAGEPRAPAGHLDVASPRAGAMRCRLAKTFRPRISERLSRIDERLDVHILVPDRKVVEIAGWELDPAAEAVELMLEHVRQISEHAAAVGQVQIPAGRVGDRARIPQPVR